RHTLRISSKRYRWCRGGRERRMRSRSSARACPNLSVPPKGCTSFSSRLEEHCSGTCKTKKFFSEARRIGCVPALHLPGRGREPPGGVEHQTWQRREAPA